LDHQQAELRGQAGERAEGHDVDQRHPPGVLVAEDVELLAMLALIGTDFSIDPREQTADDHQRDPDEGCVLVETFLVGLARGLEDLRAAEDRQPGHRDQIGRQQLDNRDPEVAEAGLQTERGPLHPPGEEEGRRGHEAGEDATADAGEEGQHHQLPVGSSRVLHPHAPARVWRRSAAACSGRPSCGCP
jgi:hypothetical protein